MFSVLTPEHARNSPEQPEIRPEHVRILNGGIYFTNNQNSSELLNYIINQVQSSHNIKWTELIVLVF